MCNVYIWVQKRDVSVINSCSCVEFNAHTTHVYDDRINKCGRLQYKHSFALNDRPTKHTQARIFLIIFNKICSYYCERKTLECSFIACNVNTTDLTKMVNVFKYALKSVFHIITSPHHVQIYYDDH